MRIENIPIEMTFKIPYDKPDLNGVIYTKEAIIKALHKISDSKLPIVFNANENKIEQETSEYKDYTKTLGFVSQDILHTNHPQEKCVYARIKGMVLFGGTCCQVNEFHVDKNSNNKKQIIIDDFTITQNEVIKFIERYYDIKLFTYQEKLLSALIQGNLI